MRRKPKPKAAANAKAKAAGGHSSSKTADGGWVFSDVHKADAAYIMKELQANAVLVPFLASMMRDKTLQGLLTKHLQGGQPAALGRKIVAKAKALRHLPPRFWQLVWENIWLTKPEESSTLKMSLEDHHELAEAMLGISMDAPLPKEHKSSSCEGPLIAVLKVRHEEIGKPCACMTWAMYVAGDWGRFRTNKPFDGYIFVDALEAGILITTPEMAEAADDWVVSYPNSPNCTLTSAKLHFSQGVLPVVKAALPAFKIEELLANYERKNAADNFPDEKKYEVVVAAPVEEACNADGSVTFEGVLVTPAKKRRLLGGSASGSPSASP